MQKEFRFQLKWQRLRLLDKYYFYHKTSVMTKMAKSIKIPSASHSKSSTGTMVSLLPILTAAPERHDGQDEATSARLQQEPVAGVLEHDKKEEKQG